MSNPRASWNKKHRKGWKEWNDAVANTYGKPWSSKRAYDLEGGVDPEGNMDIDQKLCCVEDVVNERLVAIVDIKAGVSILVPRALAKEIAAKLNIANLAIEQFSV